MLEPNSFLPIIRAALAEDLGLEQGDRNYIQGDVSASAIFTDTEKSRMSLYAKDAGILCGIALFKAVFLEIDSRIAVELLAEDGQNIAKGQKIASLQGPTRSILVGERTAINFISHLSAIATKASMLVAVARESAEKLGTDPIIILDTRKTIPGLRHLQKYAVKTGGAQNHRIGLFDMVMLKDNHIDAAGGIAEAVTRVRQAWGDKYKIEVETRSLDEVRQALAMGVERIMLDNMDNADIKKATALIDGRCEIEASGNMSRQRLAELAGSGITHISFGELTHTIDVFDFSLKEAERL